MTSREHLFIDMMSFANFHSLMSELTNLVCSCKLLNRLSVVDLAFRVPVNVLVKYLKVDFDKL